MVAGGAYAVGKHAQRNQQAEYDQEARISDLEAQQAQPQYAAPPPPAPAPQMDTGDMVKQLQDLKTLKDQGILTDAEFEVQKAKILQGAG
jgi:putative oligomerization/nucleic acid binding protein